MPEAPVLHRISTVCGALALVLGLVTLGAWFVGAPMLTAGIPGTIPMAPNTGLAFALHGLALLALVKAAGHPASLWIARGFAALVLLLATVQLLAALSLIHVRIENLVLPVSGHWRGVRMGVMAPLTAANFMIESIAILALTLGALSVAALLATVSSAVGILVLLGYLYGSPIFVATSVIPVAVSTGLAFMLTGTAVITRAGPAHWPLRPLVGASIPSLLLRAFLPLVIAVVVVEGWSKVWFLARAPHNPALAAVLLAAGTTTILSYAVNRIGRRLGKAIEAAELQRSSAEQRAARLAELDRFKEEMASLIVHDLKNPLSASMTFLSLARDELEAGNQAKGLQAMSRADDGVRRALRLIQGLLDVARLENNRLALRKSLTSLAPLIETVVRHQSSRARAADVLVTTTIDPDIAIEADPTVLLRIFENVIDNAIRYTPRGGDILVQAENQAGHIRLRIGNTGPEIPMAARQRIFEKFAQIEEPAVSDYNTGLGLYFCRLATEAHGGRVWVETTPSHPTVFVFELPSQVVAA